MTSTLPCNLKAQQKVFLLHQALAHSCCRAYPVEMTVDTTYENLSQHWSQEKQQLDQGIAVPSCEVCWRVERDKISSYRMTVGQQVSQLSIQLGFSNACNHMCVYCSPKYSTTWQKSIEMYGNFTGVARSAQTNLQPLSNQSIDVDAWLVHIQQDINTQPDHSVNLALTGGEPLMQKDSLNQVLKLISTKIKKITINTNLNPPDNRFLQWLLTEFPRERLSFEISLDATPDFNHVPRAGFDQAKFKENLLLLQDKNINFTFFAVCSVLNFFDLPNFYKWIDTHGFSSRHFKLNNPDCLDPVWIPTQFSQPILIQIQQMPEFLKPLQQSRETVDLKLKEQYNYLKQYFERTGTDVNTINAEFNQYWTWLEERFK